MLQRIIAAVMVVAGLVAAGLAVASATIWRESDTVVASATAAKDGTLLVTEPGVLNLVADTVGIRATADGPVTVAVGRDVDVDGWVGQDPVTQVTGLADWEHLATRAASPAPSATDPAETDPAETDPAAGDETSGDAAAPTADPTVADAAPDPAGSDMWIAEASGAGSAELNWTVTPGRWMLLVASTGEDATAPTVALTWHRTVTTPWLWPGVALGVVLIAAGALWWFLGLRRGRGSDGGPDGPVAADEVGEPDAAGTESGSPQHGPDAAALRAVEPEAITRVMTRREIREQEETQRAAGRPRRNWLTGSIPIVPRERRPKTSATPAVDAGPESRGDAWRRAWGMERGATPHPVPPAEAAAPAAGVSGPDATVPGGDRPAVDAGPGAGSPAADPTVSSLPTRRSRRGSHASPETSAPAGPAQTMGPQAGVVPDRPGGQPPHPTAPGHGGVPQGTAGPSAPAPAAGFSAGTPFGATPGRADAPYGAPGPRPSAPPFAGTPPAAPTAPAGPTASPAGSPTPEAGDPASGASLPRRRGRRLFSDDTDGGQQ